MNGRNFFVKFIASYYRTIALFSVCLLIFALIFFLYSLPAAPFLYGMLLCMFAGSVLFAARFFACLKKHRELVVLLKGIPESCERLCSAETAAEQDMLDIIAALRDRCKNLSNEFNTGYSEILDYYTLWAHQIKTPIASMRLRLQSEQGESARFLQEDLQRIEIYVDMIMAYLRLSSDQTDYLIKRYDIDGIIKQAAHKFAFQFISKKIKLDYSPSDLSAVTDEKWLLFAIEQLLSNAVKYTLPGGTVEIFTEKNKLFIRDNGIGIMPEDLPRIFDRGFTGRNGRRDKQASGLGLYLCKRILENLNHRLDIQSATDKGTTVTIDLGQRTVAAE